MTSTAVGNHQQFVRSGEERSILKGCCVVITTLRVKEEEISKPSHVQFELNRLDSEKQVKQF